MSNKEQSIRTFGAHVAKGIIEVALTWATAWPLILLLGAYLPDAWKTGLLDSLVDGYYLVTVIVTIVALFFLRPLFLLIINYFVALAAYNGEANGEGTNTQIMPPNSELWSSATGATSLILKLFVISQLLLVALTDRFEADVLKSDVDILKDRVNVLYRKVGL
jgi:TM2 domain-containing membrane protein YozV